MSFRTLFAASLLLHSTRLHAASTASSSDSSGATASVESQSLQARAVEDEDPDSCGVVVASNFDLRLELFTIGDDGQVYRKAQAADGFGWSSWAVIANTPPIQGGVAVVRAADRLIVAVCGTEGSIHLAAQVEPNGATGKWTAFRPVGGPEGGCTHTPGLVVGGSAQLLLFSADARRQQLWVSSWPWNGGTCDYRQLFLSDSAEARVAAGCGAWELLGGEATGAPAVAVAEGRLHVFVRGPGGALFQKVQGPQGPAAGGASAGWSNWTALAGTASSTPRLPAVTSDASMVRLYFRGVDHALHELRQVPERGGATAWSAAEPLGGVVASAPAAGVNIDGLAQLVALGPDRTVWHKRQYFDAPTLVTSWTTWGSLGGEASSGPSVARRSDGLLDVYVRGADRNLYRKPQLFVAAATNGNGSKSNELRWGSWEFLGGPVHSFPC